MKVCHSVERSTTYLKQYVNLKVASHETWVGMKPDFGELWEVQLPIIVVRFATMAVVR